ncbi:hypothetical protein ATER59S_05225 [Aquamicrobium terrae]
MGRESIGMAVRTCLALPLLLGPAMQATAQEQASSAPGVNPKDNITKTEFLYRYDSLDKGDHTQSLTLKYDRAFDARWGGNVEIPLVAYKGFGLDEAGLGDIQARVRYTGQAGNTSIILGAELVFPTATDDALGRGKYQFNPAVGAVFPLSKTSFVYLGYKHFASFAGDGDRPDINESQPRILAAYTSPAGWWILGDAKYTRSWETHAEQVDFDLELGKMVTPTTGIWTRIGTSALDSDRDASVLFGIRFIR